MIDLSHIPLVDNHCHGLFADTTGLDVTAYRHRFSESAGDAFPPDHTSTAVHYLWALRQIAGVLGCEPEERAVIEARRTRSRDELDRLFLRAANIAWLLVDDGYPEPDQAYDSEGDRDAAARRFEVQSRPSASGAIWTFGPFTVRVSGDRDPDAVDALTDALDAREAR